MIGSLVTFDAGKRPRSGLFEILYLQQHFRMIEAQALTKEFPAAGQPFLAVSGLTFQVRRGEVYGLLGPNGAGKTTTLRMILGLLQPTSGDVVVDGKHVAREPEAVKAKIGLVSASGGHYQWLTPRETLHYFADLYAMPVGLTRTRVNELIELLDLGSFFDQRCSTLSTGQKQRVTLARALIHDPSVILLDEPTRGLDIVGTHVIFEYILRLRELGKAVILSTHRLDEATVVCDRLGLLHRGRLRHEGTFDDLRRQTGASTLYEMFLLLMGRQPVGEVLS